MLTSPPYHSQQSVKRRTAFQKRVNQPTSDTCKRFCSLNICFSPERTQPRIADIFRGNRKQISTVEKETWDPEQAIKQAKRTLKPAVQGKHQFVLFCDKRNNAAVNKDAVLSCSGIEWYGLANATDIWQPFDAGYGQLLKAKIKQEFFRWLDYDENCERWYDEAMFTASEKLLITKQVGDAYREFLSSKHDSLYYSLFQKTG